MNFDTAVKLKRENQELIGKKVNGATIDEIWIYPTNIESYQKFLQLYRRNFDADKAIAPFVNENVEVRCLMEKRTFVTRNILAHLSLEEAKRN
jgi:hypothetical protein